MLTAREVMQPKVVKVSEDMLVSELASLLLSKGFSGAPVVNESGALVGVVSFSDIAAYSVARAELTPNRSAPNYYRDLWMEEDLSEGFVVEEVDISVRVRDIMTPAVYRVDESTPLTEVVELMQTAKIHRVMVTREERLVGILTTTDLMGLLPKLLKQATAA
ncbi:MAG: CBS domain-containing protein [Candidatus Eremiobacterota bacterium]